LETPKDVATKTGNARSFIVQTFTSIGRIVSPRYLSSNTKKKQKIQQVIYLTQRILVLHLPDNNTVTVAL